METVQYGTKIGVVDLESVLKQANRVQRDIDGWRNGAEAAGLQTAIRTAEKTLNDYQAQIGNAPLTAVMPVFVLDRAKPTVYVPTVEGRRVKELAGQVSWHTENFNDTLNRRISEIQNVVRNEIKQLVAALAKENGIDLVLYASSDVCYMNDAADITNDVVAIFNAM